MFASQKKYFTSELPESLEALCPCIHTHNGECLHTHTQW